MPWLDEARRPVTEVAEQLGLAGDPRRGFQCPACGVERRDRYRGAVGVRGDGRGWRCHRCGAGGDGFDLVAWHLGGRRFKELDAAGRGAVRAWFQGHPQTEASTWTVPLPQRPPRDEVEAIWECSLPITSCLPTGAAPDPRAARFLRGRGLLERAATIDAAGLARLTPAAKSTSWPSWWPQGRAWLWRLVTRAFDAQGQLASLHARAIEERPSSRSGEPLPKTLWPGSHGGPRYDAGGLFFADDAARSLLLREPAALERLLLCEGLTDWLAAAAWARQTGQQGLAVMGGVSGSFPALALLPVPAALDIVVAVDEDAAGQRYLEQIRRALPGRTVRRLALGASQ